MHKKYLIILLLALTPVSSYANWMEDLFNIGLKIYGINADALGVDRTQLDQVRKITAGLTGTHDYGSQSFNPYTFAWGSGTNDWQSILAMASHGGGSGELGLIMARLARQYPISQTLGSKNEIENQYYLMQAQTSLASRAGAELAFAQIAEEAATMQALHKKIDSTRDNKSSVDLSNRLMAENAMINIQQTKLLAILAEQAAVNAQEKVNRAKESAEFFDIR